VVNPCFLIENWQPGRRATIQIDGQAVKDGDACRQGLEDNIDGTARLVVWVRKTSDVPVDFTISEFNPEPGDLDQNGGVDAADLSILIFNWLGGGGGVQPEGDLNGDGSVNFADYAALAKLLGYHQHTFTKIGKNPKSESLNSLTFALFSGCQSG
jgi:hypothetical protein